MKPMKQILLRDIFQLHFYKRDLMNICLRQHTYGNKVETWKFKATESADYLLVNGLW